MIANGQYTAQDGTQKTNWKQAGMIGVSANGKEYVLLDPTVNIAGFPREAGKEMLICSVFEDQPKQQGGYQQQAPQQQQPYNHSGKGMNQPPRSENQGQQYQQQAPQQSQQTQPLPQVDVNSENIPF